jgi:putative MATE family efflux protein
VAEGFASGSGAVLAHAVGAADRGAARRSAAAGLTLAVLGSVVISGAGLVLIRQVFVFMGTDGAVTAAGVAYLRVILVAMPAYFVFAWVAAAFRALGDATTPLRLLGLSAVLNVVADPLLIFGVGPLPRLGVTGAAAATALSWVAAAVAGWVLLGRVGVRPRVRDCLRPPRESWTALRVGMPLSLEGALFSLIYIFLTRVVTTFGTPAVAALGVGHKLESLNYFVCVGTGAAATTLVGQSLGAGNRDRASRCAWRTLFLTALPVGAVSLILVAFPRAAVAVFSPEAAVIDAGATYVLLVGPTQIFMAAEVVLLAAFAGAHWTTVPAVSEVVLTAVRVPLAAWLASRGWGVEGVWLAIASTTVVKGVLLAVLLGWRLRGGNGTRATAAERCQARRKSGS